MTLQFLWKGLTISFLKYNNLVAVSQDNNIYIGRLKAIGY